MRYSILLLISLFQFCFAQNSLERLETSPRHHEWVKINSNSNEINSFLVYPEVSEKVPVVILIHENRGLNDWARSMTDQIAEMGYIAIAPDFLSGTAPNEAGTNGYVTTVEKNEAWSWTVVKINTSQQQSFTLDFQPDVLGNEGTQSNFKLYLTNRENNLVQEVDFNGEITVNPNLDYFLVMVNTPQRFEGWETFDYQLKVTPVD